MIDETIEVPGTPMADLPPVDPADTLAGENPASQEDAPAVPVGTPPVDDPSLPEGPQPGPEPTPEEILGASSFIQFTFESPTSIRHGVFTNRVHPLAAKAALLKELAKIDMILNSSIVAELEAEAQEAARKKIQVPGSSPLPRRRHR